MGQEGWCGEGLEGETLGRMSPTYASLSALSGLTMVSLNFEKGSKGGRVEIHVSWVALKTWDRGSPTSMKERIRKGYHSNRTPPPY